LNTIILIYLFRIFGYGSLCWRPDFDFKVKRPGYILGYQRRFYQGSTDHRGTPTSPGRVVTLLKIEDNKNDTINVTDRNVTVSQHYMHNPIMNGSCMNDNNMTNSGEVDVTEVDENEKVFGMGYLVSADKVKETVAYLDHREKDGYQRTFVTLHFMEEENKESEASSVLALLYLANNNNINYLGPDTYDNIAAQIVNSKGPSGHNTEYLFNLHNWLLSVKAHDEHIEQLLQRVKAIQAQAASK
jgi:cation transport protein ChaC